MKRTSAILLCAVICISLISCTNNQQQQETDSPAISQQPTITTTTEPSTSTTAPVKEDAFKGEKLKEAVTETLGNKDGAVIDGNLSQGGFTYKFSRDAEAMYADERSAEAQQLARDNADKLIAEIQSFYDDEIAFDRIYASPIGSGDNGIDSVRYEIFYYNTQNQQIKIFADSDGEISFVQCKFTW